MKRNYMIVYTNKFGGNPTIKYFETKKQMEEFIEEDLIHGEIVKYKYKLTEVK